MLWEKSVWQDQIFKEPHQIVSNLHRGALFEPRKDLENICHKNINRLIFARLNINSPRNKFASLHHIINKSIDVLLISETKIDSSFPSVQILLEGYATPYRLDTDVGNDNEQILNHINKCKNYPSIKAIKSRKKEEQTFPIN